MPPSDHANGDHFDGHRFFNPGHPPTDRTLPQLLRWRFTGHRTPWTPTPPITPAIPAPATEALTVTHVGHATTLIQLAGHNILVDPVWSPRASPFPFLGPRRWDEPGISWPGLPPIHAVLLTHNHYDHLDTATLRRLAPRCPAVVAPLGNAPLLRRTMPGAPLHVADWHDTISLAPNLRVTLHPAFHWSARSPFDRRRTLWCGFILQSGPTVVYIVGDTGYGTGAPFRAVQDRFGPPTLALIPIGAYEPRWFMRDQHIDPAEAVRIFQDCAARHALGTHWGTFNLTDEPRFAPRDALAEALAHHGIPPARFPALRPGDTWTVPTP